MQTNRNPQIVSLLPCNNTSASYYVYGSHCGIYIFHFQNGSKWRLKYIIYLNAASVRFTAAIITRGRRCGSFSIKSHHITSKIVLMDSKHIYMGGKPIVNVTVFGFRAVTRMQTEPFFLTDQESQCLALFKHKCLLALKHLFLISDSEGIQGESITYAVSFQKVLMPLLAVHSEMSLQRTDLSFLAILVLLVYFCLCVFCFLSSRSLTLCPEL